MADDGGGNWHGPLKHAPPALYKADSIHSLKSNFIPMSQPFQALVPLIHLLPHFLHWVACASVCILISVRICHGVSTPCPEHLNALIWEQKPCLTLWWLERKHPPQALGFERLISSWWCCLKRIEVCRLWEFEDSTHGISHSLSRFCVWDSKCELLPFLRCFV